MTGSMGFAEGIGNAGFKIPPVFLRVGLQLKGAADGILFDVKKDCLLVVR